MTESYRDEIINLEEFINDLVEQVNTLENHVKSVQTELTLSFKKVAEPNEVQEIIQGKIETLSINNAELRQIIKGRAIDVDNYIIRTKQELNLYEVLEIQQKRAERRIKQIEKIETKGFDGLKNLFN